MKSPLSDQNILLGVSGSIAAYKAADLASKLSQAGAVVDVILTQSALQFITPLTFQSVTGRKAYTDADLWGSEGHVQHIGLAKQASLLVIAPASANTLAKLAYGLADNLLTVTALAAQCPLLLAPAMDGGMYAHPATQANLLTLKQRGAHLLGPVEGHLASGLVGTGRMVEPGVLLGQIRHLLSRKGPLAGKKIVITAGGTQEAIDPVRTITNRSSGKQGFALAQAALDWGAEVTLISGPTCLETPAGAQRVDVISASEMLGAVLAACEQADALIMAAAVADFTPAAPAKEKIKRSAGAPHIQLTAGPDILKTVTEAKQKSGFPRLLVGFAAESQDLLANAHQKLQSKKVDLLVANDISSPEVGFSVDTNRVTILDAAGGVQELPLMSKAEVAHQILQRVTELLTKHD